MKRDEQIPGLALASIAVTSSMEPVADSPALSGRTVLVSPNQAAGEFAAELARSGARVLAWPGPDIGEPANYEVLDEALENLFGYDWLIFQNALAVNFFLGRFQTMGHEISELDSLRVCGVGEETTVRLEHSQVHLDIVPDGLSLQATVDAIETYLGGPDALRGLNFLVPGAGHSRVYLQDALEGAGGRVDLVAAYRTCAASESELARLDALMTGGGIDCVIFESQSELREFAQVFDTNDLGKLLAGVTVACSDTAARTAAGFSLTADLVVASDALAQEIASHFRPDWKPSTGN